MNGCPHVIFATLLFHFGLHCILLFLFHFGLHCILLFRSILVCLLFISTILVFDVMDFLKVLSSIGFFVLLCDIVSFSIVSE
jgi:hypothetical protein